MHNNLAIIIPARLNSSRFNRKVLANLGDKKLIEWVMQNALDANIGHVVLAYAEEEILEQINIKPHFAIKTNPSLANGTLRIYDAYKQLSTKHGKQYKYVINLQGDLPICDPHILVDIANSLTTLEKKEIFDIVTPVCEIRQKSEINNPNVVKVALSGIMDAVYFSRAAVPYGANKFYKHIGIYGFSAHSLQKFINLPPSKLENYEKLEQLRALENGMKIRCIEALSCPISVDTKEDLLTALKHIENI